MVHESRKDIYFHLGASFPKSNVEEWYIWDPDFISSYVNILLYTCYICIKATWLGGSAKNHVPSKLLTEAGRVLWQETETPWNPASF